MSNVHPIKPREWTALPKRKCLSQHTCVLCKHTIRLGDSYYDGGIRRRAHLACVLPCSQPEQPSCADLNRQIAREILGQHDKSFVNPLGDKLIHWYDKGMLYLGIGPEPPGNWSRNITEAFPLLAPWIWTLYTCEAGYCCKIHKTPERSEELLGQGMADSPMKAICIAALETHRTIHRTIHG